MAVKINTTLTIGDGIEIPSGAVVVPSVHTLKPVPYMDGETKKYRRVITYDNFLFQNLSAYQDDMHGTRNMYVNEIPAGWEKEMTDAEFAELTGNGLKAEMWLRDHFNSLLGGNYCEIINAAI